MASLKKRGTTYYAQYYLGGQQKRVCLGTESLQIAKEKIRQIESALARGTDIPLPTKTPIPEILTAYVQQLRAVKTERNAQRDIFYLREAFGPVCPAVQLKSANVSANARRRPCRNRPQPIQTNHFEQITTADIAQHIAVQVRSKGLAPQDRQPFSGSSDPPFQLGDAAARHKNTRERQPGGEGGALQGESPADFLSHHGTDRHPARSA